jgi:hypothetical protein
MTGHPASDAVDEFTGRLWTEAVGPAAYEGAGEKYQTALLEQYKLYVEMTDRVSARRALANTFFLTLNSTVFTAVGVFWTTRPTGSVAWLALPLVVLTGQCAAWFWLLSSYRALNQAKYRVIGELEQRLPASPYWRAEWHAEGRVQRRRRQTSLTAVEQVMPVLFAVTYVLAFILVLNA